MSTPDGRMQVGFEVHAQKNIAIGGASIVSTGRDLNLRITHHHYHGELGIDRLSKHTLWVANQDFVYTDIYLEARQKLYDDNLAVLCGERHTGRKSAARNMLFEASERAFSSGHPLDDIARLRPTWLRPSVRWLPQRRGYAYFLDLSETVESYSSRTMDDSRPDSSFGEDLVEFSAKLRELDSYLVVVTTPEVWESCAITARSVTWDWIPPDPRALAERRLSSKHENPELGAWLNDPPIGELLNQQAISPAEAIRLADAIAHAAEAGHANAREVAVDEFKGWTKYLQRWFRSNNDEYNRAYFIASAVLDGARDHEVISAGDSLLRAIDDAPKVLNPLKAPDISERLAKIEARVRDDGTLSLNDARPGLSEAVLNHVWRERPNIQSFLVAWLVELATKDKASTVRREHIAGLLTNLAIRQNDAARLLNFVREQAEKGGTHYDLAVQILDNSVLSPDIGRDIRSRLNSWSIVKDPIRLKLTVAVCGGKLGIERTDLALNRLGKILENKEAPTEVVQAAGRALARLAERLDTRVSVLEKIDELLSRNPPVGARIFLELARMDESTVVPVLLQHALVDRGIEGRLARIWAATYDSVGVEVCAPVMCDWVVATENRLSADAVLAVCLPTLRRTAAHSLDARVVTAAPPALKDRIMEGIVKYKLTDTGENS